MLDLWNRASLDVFDALLGWALHLPRSVVLVVVALLTALAITLIRKWTTNQDRLRRAADDLHRLKELRRAAKRTCDRDTADRIQATKSQIALLKLKAELKPLLAILVPLALLATWAFYRLEFHPPRADETIEVIAYLPISAQDDVLHLVPKPGLQAVNGWVQEVHLRENPPSAWDRVVAKLTSHEPQSAEPDAVAVWQVKGDAAAEPYRLEFRWKERTLRRQLLVGQTVYSPPIDADGPVTLQVRMRDARFLGIPGLGAWLPAWIVGYLLLTIPLVPLLKRLLRVY